jgi:membrane protease YdiL (CAAX protease family)
MLFAFYGVFALVGIGWDAWREGPSAMIWIRTELWYADLAMGLGLGLLTVAFTALLSKLSATARRLEQDLREAIGRPGNGEIFLYALTSSVGEEILFRGGMQPSLGVLITSLVFGFVHGGFIGRMWLWSVFALLMGLALGGLQAHTGALAAPIVAHFVVNLVNLHRLTRPVASPLSGEVAE